jgi:hypothetical protein
MRSNSKRILKESKGVEVIEFSDFLWRWRYKYADNY